MTHPVNGLDLLVVLVVVGLLFAGFTYGEWRRADRERRSRRLVTRNLARMTGRVERRRPA